MLLAPARAGRPHDVGGASPVGCPFCPGNEAATPPETQAVRPPGGEADGPGWTVRAVPNKFPTVPADEGSHEVVINAPRHLSSLAELTAEEAGDAVAVWADRLRATAADPRGLTPYLFLNQGALAGASLTHTHAQIVGLPMVPGRLAARDRAFSGRPGLLLDDIADDRLVARREGLVAWCPEVPSMSGVIRLAPEAPAPDWRSGVDGPAIGAVLSRLVGAVESRLSAENVNLCLFERPPSSASDYHWHLDVIPRLGTLAGLELGAGVIAAHRAPREVAAELRVAFDA